MLKAIKRIPEGLINSFTNEPVGFSARKLTSFWFVVLVTLIQFIFVSFCLYFCYDIIKKANVSQYYLIIEILMLIIYVLIINLLQISLLLGVVTLEQIIKFKSKHDAEKQSKNSDTNNNNTDNNNSV